jgi:hypothetical protein
MALGRNGHGTAVALRELLPAHYDMRLQRGPSTSRMRYAQKRLSRVPQGARRCRPLYLEVR